MPGILVGVDGSDPSRRALAWAMQQAIQRKVPLTVIYVTPGQVRPATHIYWNMPTLPEGGLSQEQARESVQAFVDQVGNEIGETVPEITISAVNGDPAEELVRAARDADLLVVGRRGGGGFHRLMMGSVSSKVTHHAACPVTVVPGRGEASHGSAE
jgi:nucleotide-binding universal stress UspA family protein